MISVIVCSANDELFSKFSTSVSQTIGTEFEIIRITDAKETGGICAAYNRGAAGALYPFLCFSHDDIIFHTDGWGVIVTSLLKNKETGLAGVAGAVFKSPIPSPWWVSNYEDVASVKRYLLIQHYKGEKSNGINRDENNITGLQTEVAVIDGLWMCCRKNVWEQARFDEKSFNAFHFYDLDFSMTVRQAGYRNTVMYNILIEHFSAGEMDDKWISDALVFHTKWKRQLPVSLAALGTVETKWIKTAALKNFLLTITQNKERNLFVWCRYWLQYIYLKPFSRQTYSFALQQLKKQLSLK